MFYNTTGHEYINFQYDQNIYFGKELRLICFLCKNQSVELQENRAKSVRRVVGLFS